MLADADRTAASNGTSRPYSNGKLNRQSSTSGTANGTNKVAAALNGSSNKTRLSETYFDHDREEVTRILIQALADMGYHSAAQSVSQESGYELESPMVAAFRKAILGGDWGQAEQLLSGATVSGEGGNGLVLANGADKQLMRFWIRQQKFLELLEQRETGRALTVLRNELTPLYQDTQKLHFLSSLLMCQKTEDLKSKAEWDGAYGESRRVLLSQLSKCISPSVMLPEHRLATLLRQVKSTQIERCLWHSSSTSPSLYADHLCDRRRFPTINVLELDQHDSQVWQVKFSHDGTKLASCGEGKQVIIWDVPSFKPLHYLKDHDDGVGNVAWSLDDSKLVTCSQDRHARLWDANTGALIKKLDRGEEPVTSCVWSADNKSFIIGSLSISAGVGQYSLSGELLGSWSNRSHRVEDLAISPDGRWLVASDGGSHIYVYSCITRQLEYQMDLQVRITSVNISRNSRHLLVNHNNGVAQLIDLILREPIQNYSGFTGGNFVIRSAFGGADESFVISGSEDGSINIWHKISAQLVEKLNGHAPGCNSVSWSPTDPCLFASCGDDGKIKIWSNNDWLMAHREENQLSNSS